MAYTRFFRCGQAGLLGGYPTHFHKMQNRLEDVYESYVSFNVTESVKALAVAVQVSRDRKVAHHWLAVQIWLPTLLPLYIASKGVSYTL